MSDSNTYLPSASSTESCDTSYSSRKRRDGVASTVQSYEGELPIRRFLACGVQGKIRTKYSRYWMCSLFHFCFVFYCEIYLKNGEFRCLINPKLTFGLPREGFIDFRKSRLGESTALSSLCLCQYPPEVRAVHATRYRDSLRKGLNFITNDAFLLLKYDGNKNW